MSSKLDTPLKVEVTDSELVIRIGVNTLAHGVLAENGGPINLKVIDPMLLAKGISLAMGREAEDGATPLTDFIDAMAVAAEDDGTDGLDYDGTERQG